MKINKPKSITSTVLNVFDGMKIGEEYSGYELKRMCVSENSKMRNCYIETLLKILRAKRRSEILCIDHYRSKYRKVENR